MMCYVLAMGKQHLGQHVVVGYGIKIFWPRLFITSPDHLVMLKLMLMSQCKPGLIDLQFTLEYRNCLNLFSMPISLRTCSN